ncbi:MAG: glycosyltransferase family 2 protein [Elusimicrobia bacterium]|nr:glycosyltransferase family 2 protein [Elusimicrobiota bacterium]
MEQSAVRPHEGKSDSSTRLAQTLTVIIIAGNEEEDLPACLRSIEPLGCRVALIDGGSQDATARIARQAGADVVNRPFDNFPNQRSFAYEQATTPWILQIDADERLTGELCREITQTLERPAFDAYRLPFRVSFMGREMRFSGLGRQQVLRLFKKEAAQFQKTRHVHESLDIPEHKIGVLTKHVRHRPYKDLAEYLAKCEWYTDLAAKDFVAAGKKLSWRHHLIPAWEFLHCYVLRLGFLDGFPGFAWAFLSAYHKRVRYAKVRQLLSQ